jgi:hypothetical protein
LQLLDKIEKEEQADKAERDKTNGQEHLEKNEPADGVQA